MEKILKKKELVNELSARTGFYKMHLSEILDALDDIIVENMGLADKDGNSEIHLSHGFVFGGRFAPARPAKDPRTNTDIITPAKIIPYVKFKPSFRKKINK